MNILHITNDFLGSSVYKELYSSFSGESVHQIVYCPLRASTSAKGLTRREPAPYEVIFSSRMKKLHRFFFHSKIRFLFNDILTKVDFQRIEIIHATTWFSDGALAYTLFKRLKVPYLVTVRNTDLNLFFKYMIHLRPLGLEILRNAKKIVFVSPVYFRRFEEHPYFAEHISEFRNKIHVIPNGINSFWIKNCGEKRSQISDPVKLLFIGKFTKDKNVRKVIHAVDRLVNLGGEFQLNLVGGGGGDSDRIAKLIEGKKYIVFHGKIHDRETLKSIFRDCHIFVMPSKHETFGLVYIEALSQGLPIIFTKNEGVDGLYDSRIGEAVNASDLKNIICAIQRIASRYGEYSFCPQHISNNHNWQTIADAYLSLYSDIINN